MRQTDLKIIILGALGVGKTSLLHQYIHNVFYHEYRCTLGANVQQKSLMVDGHSVRLQVWDTGAQERFRSMVPVFYKDLDGCILTFDLTDMDTFMELERWRQSVLDHSRVTDTDLPFIVLGNKMDIQNRQVSQSEARTWCEERNMEYLEVSAKDSANVEQAFSMAARHALSWHKHKLASTLTDSFKLKPDVEKKKACCA